MSAAKFYHNTTAEKMKEQKVRALRPLKNGYMKVPAGTILTIRGKMRGFSLESPACKTCGVSVYFYRVDPSAVELV